MANVTIRRAETENACPECGAYWGHSDPKLDYPNREKVYDDEHAWLKCYNPMCYTQFYTVCGRQDKVTTPWKKFETLVHGVWQLTNETKRYVLNDLARRCSFSSFRSSCCNVKISPSEQFCPECNSAMDHDNIDGRFPDNGTAEDWEGVKPVAYVFTQPFDQYIERLEEEVA